MIGYDISPLFDDLMTDLSSDWRVDFNDLQIGMPYDLNIDQNIIILPSFGLRSDQALASPYFRPQILIGLIQALRMARHVEWLEGALSQYHPETILLIGRICVADTITHLIHTAFNLKINAKDNDLWKHILCGEWSDMAQIYATSRNHYKKDQTDDQKAESMAMAAAFNHWFASQDRLKTCDHDTLNIIDQMIADQTIFEQKSIAKNAVTCLTLQSGKGATYLGSSLQDDILKNPYYRAMNDPINQAHFMQVITDMNHHRVGGLIFRDPSLAVRFIDVEAVC